MMSLSTRLRFVLPLVLGLALGGSGVFLFQESLIGPEGSAEARAAALEVELKKAQNQVAAFEDTDALGRRKSLRTTRDRLGDIRDRLESGRPVTPDEVFRLTQPFMRDLAPLLERMRYREQQRSIERMSGEFARSYGLNPSQQEALRKWFDAKAEQNAREWTRLVTSESTRVQDLMKAARDVRADDGIDEFMSGILTDESLARFQSARMEERIQRVQQEADVRTERLHEIVTLDDRQRDQVFGIMARQSRDYHPSMRMEGGVGEIDAGAPGNAQQAIAAVLRPDQLALYEQERQQRREAAEEDLRAIGLTLPDDWDPIGMEDF